MPRDLSAGMVTPLTGNLIVPAFLVTITFKSQTVNLWTGVGTIVVNGTDFLGVGDLGTMSPITEGTDVQAYGMSLTLSGIDPLLLSEALGDIQLGAPCTVSLVFLNQQTGAVLGSPYPIFSGNVDQPTVSVGMETISITLALENKLSDLMRASNRRYTSADQQAKFPSDNFCFMVEALNDQALLLQK